MSRNTENKEEILKVHNRIDLIDQKLDTLENNHLAHMQKDIDRIIYIISAIGLGLLGQFLYLLTKNL
jgi:tetrahydromethanopterin S-methyltransferase subunit G|tara:strand:+ start:388 stop:588 length:201 start_codon:yes stop_codon:yes gene_type:complete